MPLPVVAGTLRVKQWIHGQVTARSFSQKGMTLKVGHSESRVTGRVSAHQTWLQLPSSCTPACAARGVAAPHTICTLTNQL